MHAPTRSRSLLPMNRIQPLAAAGLGVALALTAGCHAPGGAEQVAEQAAEPDLSGEVGQLDLGIEGIELGIALASTTADGTVRSRFTLRSVDGGATRVTGLRIELWIDADGDGAAGADERGVLLGVREPAGTDTLSLPFEVPFERGLPLRFVAQVDSTAGSTTIPGDFALPQ